MSSRLTFRAILGPEGIERNRSLRIGADGAIEAIEVGEPPYDGFLALPGMPNAHSHAFQRALAGRGEAARGEDSFWSWREAMYRLANSIEPEQMYAIARQAYAEMLAAGFTRVVEFHYLHHRRDGSRGPEMTDAVCRAAGDAGLPMTLLPVYYRSSGIDGAPAAAGQRRFAHDSVEDFVGTLSRVGHPIGGVAPHSLRAVPVEDLPALVNALDSIVGPAAPLHIHVSEQTAEVEACRERFGQTPIERLADAVDLGPRWGLIHATHATAEERRLVRAAGATVVLCPLTEAYLGDGLFEAGEHMREGGGVAVGSDADVRISAVEELRLLEYGQRLRDRLRARLGDADGLGAALWSRLAAGGARAAGADVGRLAPGLRADVIVLDGESPALAGHEPETALDAWIVGGTSADIESVYVAGRRRAGGGVVDAGADGLRRFDRALREIWAHA